MLYYTHSKLEIFPDVLRRFSCIYRVSICSKDRLVFAKPSHLGHLADVVAEKAT